MYKKLLKGDKCSLVKFEFKKGDERLTELIYNVFTEKETEEFLNPDYLNYRTRSKIRSWIRKKSKHPYEVWYAVRAGRKYVGYICFKWRKHYDEACEISTAIQKEYRGLKLGYESSRLLIDYILSLKKFRYIVAYIHTENIKARKNLGKIGFRKAQRLQKTVSRQFYNDDGTSCTGRKYWLYAIYPKYNKV